MTTTLTRFYSDPRRKRSRERDVGLYWRDGERGPTYRAAWLAETGELVSVRHGAVNDGGGVVELLAMIPYEHDLEDALDGWEDVCGEPGSMGWLRARAKLWPYACAA
jgi:hypothetical protein